MAADLNGVQGPVHLLELSAQIGLSPEQVTAIEAIFAAMQVEAWVADRLRALIDTAAEAKAELCFIHLSRHLETPSILTADQIALYNASRVYGAADPCAAVSEGHDPAMWRRHHKFM